MASRLAVGCPDGEHLTGPSVPQRRKHADGTEFDMALYRLRQ
jgi:hypothetical protein